MADQMDMMPQLTLTPDADTATPPAAPEAPVLTLDPSGTNAAQAAAQAGKDVDSVALDESRLSESERKMVEDFAQKIDITDSNLVFQYGAAAQKNIAAFSENALNSVRTKDLGEIGEALSSLVIELKHVDAGEEKKGGIFGFFQKKRDELEALKTAYTKAEVNVDKIVTILE